MKESTAQLTDLPSKILVCVNDNPHSHVALRFACSKARKTNAKVDVLHIVDASNYQSAFAVGDVMRQEMLEEGEKVLQSFAEEAHQWAGVMPSLILREGRVGEEIARTIEQDSSINMLVIGIAPESSGRGSILPWLASQLGSKLLIPMTVVPGNLTEQQIKALT